ncbi:MAG: L-methionine (R)-S-oxide reductase [Bacteroidota bacterium]|jgi:GAF domain-containing protein|nr:L-methionine (R)-S-oxide reductase [Bacteroidota bacterium]
MSEAISVSATDKRSKYEELFPQLVSLIGLESDTIANMANLCAALKDTFNFLWIGFYIVKVDQLVLGPFQGPIACTRIGFGKGVCGTAWKNGKTLVVPDVNAFPGHIACSSLSKSEIVVPVINNEQVIAVLDVDSDQEAFFDEIDAQYLEKIVRLLKF